MTTAAAPSRKERAIELLRSNHLDEAKELCEEVVRNENSAGAWYLLGIIHGRQGNLLEAERCSREAIRLHPGYTDAHCNLGAVLRAQGRFDEAIAVLRQALKLHPDHAESHYHLGVALVVDQRLDEGIESLREATRLRPDHIETHLHLGAALATGGRFEEAANSFYRVLALNPELVTAHVYLGNVYVALGRMKDATASYREALQWRPRDPETLNNLGNALSELGHKDEAIATYRKALECDSRSLATYHNLGQLLLDLGRSNEAIDTYRAALRVDSRHPGLLADLGAALSDQKKHDEAIIYYRQSLAAEPEDPVIHYNLANTLWAMGKFSDAIEQYRATIRLQFDDADAHMNLGLVHLSLGNFRDGWKEYDWQWKRDTAQARPFTPSTWKGPELGGRAVFLHDEQGLGDELFFLRFVPWLRNCGASEIAYRPSAKLVSLLARLPTLNCLAARDEHPSDSALIFSVGDLPRLLGMGRVEQIPPPVALTPLSEKRAVVLQKLAELGRPPYLGVTWRAGTTKKNALYKESPLAIFAHALQPVSATILILQRHPAPGEIDQFATALGRPVHDLSALNDDLESMLALLSLIDDYVGVSNTNMHLRAGVGKTARVLVPTPPEWRWMAEGKESPWFPGFSVYRQGYDGSWEGAMEELRKDLISYLCVGQ